jgi:hypothetical protein
VRKLSVLAAAALLASLAAAARPASRDTNVLAIDRVPGRERLVFADPLTLRPRGPASLDLSGHAWPYAFNATRSRVVLGRWQPPSLRIVDVRRLRALRDVWLGGSRRVEIKAVAWLKEQIVVLVEEHPQAFVVLRVDPGAGRVVRAVRFKRWSPTVASTPTRVVVLLAPMGRIGTARLLVVTSDRARAVHLTGISAGSVSASRGKPHRVSAPGLAVSPFNPLAWVIGAAGSAEVNLETLAVRYRGRTRQPASTVKEPVIGTAREARWLSPGQLVVAGWDARRNDGGRIVFEPSGLRVLDTTSWSDRTIHPRALLFYVRGPHLLTIAPAEPECTAPLLTAYTLSGVESYRVCEEGATGEIEFAGSYVRLGRIDDRVAVVHLATGGIVARVRDVRVTALDGVQ